MYQGNNRNPDQEAYGYTLLLITNNLLSRQCELKNETENPTTKTINTLNLNQA